MMRRSWLLVAPLLLSTTPAVAAPATDSPRARALNGEIVVSVTHLHRPVRRVRVLGTVERPADQVYAVFTKFPDYPKIFPYLKRCEVTGKTGDHLTTKSVFPMPWPFPERWVDSRVAANPALHRLRWDYLGGNIRHYSGSVAIEALGKNRSLVDLEAAIDPSLPWIPGPLLSWFTKNALPNIIIDVRRHLGENVERRWN